MLVCRPRPRRLTALAFCRTSPARSNSASASSSTSTSMSTSPTSSLTEASTSQSADNPQDSIFTAPESPWDHVFSDIPDSPPPLSTRRLRTRLSPGTTPNASGILASLSGRDKDGTGQKDPLMRRSSGMRQQRASISAREMSVFNEMFDLIFNAVSARDGVKSSGSGSGFEGGTAMRSSVPSFSGQTPGIGRSNLKVNDVFRALRRHTSRVRWTTAIDEELDRKKETMELFNTDHELLQWVTMELFGEAQRWDEEATRAIAASSPGAQAKEDKGGEPGSKTAKESMDAAATSPPSSSHKEHAIDHSIYPHLVAHAMRIFRTTYSNPSLSLVIFNHAARVSIPSYVFGCTAPAYNELMEAKWEGWGDLEGVYNALEEMRVNGVKIDGRTRIVVEKVRREVGEARPEVLEECGVGTEGGFAGVKDVNPLARRVWEELGEAEVARLLHQIERLALRDRPRKSTSSAYEESWKSTVLRSGEDDEWSFDVWSRERKTGETKKRRREPKGTSRDETCSRTLDDWTVPGAREGAAALH